MLCPSQSAPTNRLHLNTPGKDEFVDLLHRRGYWRGPNDFEAYEEGPLTVEEAGYEVVGKADRPVRLGK
jgi:hypothetical protein